MALEKVSSPKESDMNTAFEIDGARPILIGIRTDGPGVPAFFHRILREWFVNRAVWFFPVERLPEWPTLTMIFTVGPNEIRVTFTEGPGGREGRFAEWFGRCLESRYGGTATVRTLVGAWN